MPNNTKEEERVHYLDKCSCCLEDSASDLKDIWGQYITDGVAEIYGELLSECLSLALQDVLEYADKICDKCIDRLRVSLAFRREAMASKDVLEQLKESRVEIKVENEEDEVCKKVEDSTEIDDEDLQEEESMMEDSMMEDSQHMEAEYTLEYVDEDKEAPETDTDMMTEYLEDDVEVETVKCLPKQICKQKQMRKSKHMYKQYSSDDLELAVQAVVEEEMTAVDAAATYNIPVKTLRVRVKKFENVQDDIAVNKESLYSKDGLAAFYKEIRKVLTYTNATPYKTKVGRYFCAYCSTQGPNFLDVDELRTHTRTKHADERIKSVDKIMRPTYLNEVLKLDIYKLQCTVCMTDIPDWNGMFKHLKQEHGVEFELAYTRVIPYILDVNCGCALCEKSFSHYHLLDVHMNTHYNNYICGECGDTFLAETRLKKHTEIHSTGKYPCPECGKEFSLEKYRKKHYDFVHLKEHKFKCNYCSEIFNSAFLRHQHVEMKHPSIVKTFECQHCKQTFTWRPYYLKHIRLNHSNKYQCKLCSKSFRQKHEIKNHLEWHKGTGYTCEDCGKKFSSKNYLQKHKINCKEVIVFQVS